MAGFEVITEDHTQPNAGTQRLDRKSDAAIPDLEHDAVCLSFEGDPGPGGFAVFGNIAQTLLRDLVETGGGFASHRFGHVSASELDADSVAGQNPRSRRGEP